MVATGSSGGAAGAGVSPVGAASPAGGSVLVSAASGVRPDFDLRLRGNRLDQA
ncbi:MAG: hypothetical protein MZW92_47815 [Comamonadaceae bacterium]|nr:hypothetical protein [Comamonadaceae bacterium]